MVHAYMHAMKNVYYSFLLKQLVSPLSFVCQKQAPRLICLYRHIGWYSTWDMISTRVQYGKRTSSQRLRASAGQRAETVCLSSYFHGHFQSQGNATVQEDNTRLAPLRTVMPRPQITIFNLPTGHKMSQNYKCFQVFLTIFTHIQNLCTSNHLMSY